MSDARRVKLLRHILAVKVVVTFLLWGLPALAFPAPALRLFGVPIPDDTLFVRLFGVATTAFAVGYWFAYKDPTHNVAMLRAGIVNNGLMAMAILAFTLFFDLRSVFLWVSALLAFMFFLSFTLLAPRAGPA